MLQLRAPARAHSPVLKPRHAAPMAQGQRSRAHKVVRALDLRRPLRRRCVLQLLHGKMQLTHKPRRARDAGPDARCICIFRIPALPGQNQACTDTTIRVDNSRSTLPGSRCSGGVRGHIHSNGHPQLLSTKAVGARAPGAAHERCAVGSRCPGRPCQRPWPGAPPPAPPRPRCARHARP